MALYAFRTHRFSASQIEEKCGKVIAATPAMAWAVGLGAEYVISSSYRKGYAYEKIDEKYRSKSLSAKPKGRKPSTSELYARLGIG
jgi:hypothetical protein